MSKYCRGKKPARHDPRTLKLSRYLTPELPPPPESVDWTGGASFPMDGNDQLGDCTAAAVAHLIQAWTLDESGTAIVPTLDQVIAFYSGSTGYVPGDPSTDQGGDMLTVLTYLRRVGMGGLTIDGFASVNQANLDHVKIAINLFGGIDIGIGVTDTAEQQFDAGQPWTLDPNDMEAPEGHSIPILGYGDKGLLGVTWGGLIWIDPAFFAARCDEAYVLWSKMWAPAGKASPCGLMIDQLVADAEALS